MVKFKVFFKLKKETFWEPQTWKQGCNSHFPLTDAPCMPPKPWLQSLPLPWGAPLDPRRTWSPHWALCILVDGVSCTPSSDPGWPQQHLCLSYFHPATTATLWMLLFSRIHLEKKYFIRILSSSILYSQPIPSIIFPFPRHLVNNNNLRYADDSTLIEESKEELRSLLMKMKEESGKVGLKLNTQET